MDIKELDQQAFPTSAGGHTLFGMTLRDYFAAQTLQGLLASGLDQPKFEFARKSYEMADEMLKARKA